jgi:FKBP-type peptidyl-prolyl cis-trans isomerase
VLRQIILFNHDQKAYDMKAAPRLFLIAFVSLAAACSRQEPALDESQPVSDEAAVTTDDEDAAPAAAPQTTEIAPGLSMRKLDEGTGEAAEPGQTVVVHYTGWLYDPNAANHRGQKFDSSVDRGQPFEFPLGAGSVIKGWDQGVAGMLIGEVRELTIAPELAYGERGAGGVIPPGATLVFEVELLDLRPAEGM